MRMRFINRLSASLATVIVFSVSAPHALAQAAPVSIDSMPMPVTVDIARKSRAWQRSGVYLLFGSSDLSASLRHAGHAVPRSGLLYVGRAQSLGRRLEHHLRGSSSFSKNLRAMLPALATDSYVGRLRVSLIEIADPAVRDVTERQLIAELQPPANRLLKGGMFPAARSPKHVPRVVGASTVRASARAVAGTALKMSAVGAAITILPIAASQWHQVQGGKSIRAALVEGGREAGGSALLGAVVGGGLTAAGITLTAPVIAAGAVIGGGYLVWELTTTGISSGVRREANPQAR